MTQLGLDYLKHQEQRRTNLATEAETNRANLAKEGENLRHNTATESQAAAELAEKERANRAGESLTAIRDAATKAHYERADAINKAHYERSDAEQHRANVAKEDETQRSNVARETENRRTNEMNELINNLRNTEGSSYYQTKLLGDQVYNKLISATSNPEQKAYLQEQKSKLEKETNKRRYADRIYEMYKTLWGGASKAIGNSMAKS